MGKCIKCGKKGLFLKLTNGLCPNCFNNSGIDSPDIPQSQTKNLSTNFSIKSKFDTFRISPEILEILWFNDGNLKNYNVSNKQNFNYGFTEDTGIILYTEPSLISVSNPIATQVEFPEQVEPLPYFPHYSLLTPEQRFLYLKYLENPFNANTDMGYVFLFYYGLERHLYQGNFEKAFDLILKLRKVYKNHSFQNYSFCSLALTSIARKRYDLFDKLIEQDKQSDSQLNLNFLLLVKNYQQQPLSAEECMRYARRFNFTNTKYIKDYPDLFKTTLDGIFKEQGHIYPSSFLKTATSIQQQTTKVFANCSLNAQANILNLVEIFGFKEKCYEVLLIAHEKVKEELKANKNQYQKLNKAENPIKNNNPKSFEVICCDTVFDDYFESLENEVKSKYNFYIEQYKTNKREFIESILSTMKELFRGPTNEFWLLRDLKVIYSFREKILETIHFTQNLNKTCETTIEELLYNLNYFYDYAKSLNGTEEEKLLNAYLDFCKDCKPIFVCPIDFLLDKPKSEYYKDNYKIISNGLDTLRLEIDYKNKILNANEDNIYELDNKAFKQFLVIKFRIKGYSIKDLSKGTAFVIQKNDKSILIGYRTAKSTTTLSSLKTTLQTKDYLELEELWVYSFSDYAADLKEYANNNNIKLFEKEEINQLTRLK